MHPQSLATKPIVYGRIEAWGRIIEHVNGFRCQFATIASLIIQDDHQLKWIEPYAKQYDVPVTYDQTAKTMADRYYGRFRIDR